MVQGSAAARSQILATVREFVRREVSPRAAEHDVEDTYPHELVEQMKRLGSLASRSRRSTAALAWTTPPLP